MINQSNTNSYCWPIRRYAGTCKLYLKCVIVLGIALCIDNLDIKVQWAFSLYSYQGTTHLVTGEGESLIRNL